MPSNELPDMSGNPMDEPLRCDWCSEPIPNDNPYGCESDEDKVFCSQSCADCYDDDVFQEL